MIKKKYLFILLSFLFNFCCCSLLAQDTAVSKFVVADTTDHHRPNDETNLKPAGLIAPGVLIIYGGLKPLINGIARLDENIRVNVQQSSPNFHSNAAADYLMWVPSASIYVMDAFHVKTAHNFREHLILEAGSVVLTGGIGYGMRLISRNIKAYESEGTKFPSGHTANAFRGAEIFHQELKKAHPILSYSGYVIASGVGVLRIYDKVHLLSEVIAGAGLGILSTKLTYWIFNKFK